MKAITRIFTLNYLQINDKLYAKVLIESEPKLTFTTSIPTGLKSLTIPDHAYVVYIISNQIFVNTGHNFKHHIIQMLKEIYKDDSEILL